MEETRLIFSILRVVFFLGATLYFIRFQKYIPKTGRDLQFIILAFFVITVGSFLSIWGNYPQWLQAIGLEISSAFLITLANVIYLIGALLLIVGLVLWSKSVIKLHGASAEAKDFREQLIEQNGLLRDKTRDLEIRTVDYFEQREAALESERSKVNFLRNTSHELRTPLNAIIGLSELLVDHPVESDKERKEFAKMILDSGRKLLSTIDTILEIARINSSEYSPSLLAGDITVILQECVTQCLPKAHAKSISIDTPPKGTSQAYATFDRKASHQVFVNILDNALTFSPPNTTISITMDLSEHDFVTVVIKDQGPGIAAEFMDTIFEIFGRAEHWQNRGEGSKGFGLALSRKMIEIQHGKLRVESDGKNGTTCYVSLPAGSPPL